MPSSRFLRLLKRPSTSTLALTTGTTVVLCEEETKKKQFIPSVNEDLNSPHNVTLTEGQISTILYVLEGYIQGSDDYNDDTEFAKDVDSIFERLEGVVDNFYS